MNVQPPLSRRVEYLLADFAERSHARGVSEAADEVESLYVAGNDTLLARLAPVLMRAQYQSHVQDQLDTERERLHHGHLDHQERVSAGHHYEVLRHAACEFNHLLRGFIEGHREELTRDELKGALVEASHGHERWAEAEITGSVSEIALHAALMGMPELTGMRYGTLDEDLRGFDFTAIWQGQQMTIDAKTGRYAPIAELQRGYCHLEIYVPRDCMDGFRLTRHGLDSLRREVRVALNQAKRINPPPQLA